MRIDAITFRIMTRTWAVLVAVGLATTGALAGHAAWRAIADHSRAPATVITGPVIGYEAEDHFPGAALIYADLPPAIADDPTAVPAPAQGVTGTIALPALPVSAAQAAAIVSTESGIVAAQPFSTRAASSLDRARALECLTAAIYYEAASEPDAGQAAVAQVILNRARHPAFPATICGVVYQGSEHAGCQFSFACDGAMARVPMRSAWARAARTASAALAGYVYAPVGLATHYHTYAVTPAWNRSLVMTDVVGAHFFHRWKGFWGTAAAFRQVYRGGEPLPGPHIPVVPEPASPALVFAAAGPVPVAPKPVTDAAQVRKPYADSGSYLTPPPASVSGSGDRLPAASQILDRWKDSGKPLR